MSTLIALDAALAPVRARSPLAPVALPLGEARGCVLADSVMVRAAAPAVAVALRAGYAVAALDTVGATVQSPVMLPGRLVAVRIGEPLPPGTDAVVKPNAVEALGPFTQVQDAIAPGEGVRLAGHDAPAGIALAKAGDALTALQVVALAAAGLGSVPVRMVRVRMTLADPAIEAWIETLMATHGAQRTTGEADLVLADQTDDTPRLALAPGETAAVAANGQTITIALPTRFDGAVAATLALVRPVLLHLSGLRATTVARPLARKLVSAVGLTDVVLLRAAGTTWEPLGVGEITATSLAQAEAFALIPPAHEGHAAGDSLAAVPLTGAVP